MKNKSYQASVAFCIILCLLFVQAYSQNAVFLHQGNISFEKKVNVYALLDQTHGSDPQNIWDKTYVDAYKSKNPQFKITPFSLVFKDGKTLYKPAESTNDDDFGSLTVGNKNIVYSDLEKQQVTMLKAAFDKDYLIKDSTRKIRWKITDEIREIAGFQCRRANAIIMDSIYVVAFYTNEITTTGGPESFNGLPGMILEVALPYLHVIWTATKISVTQPVMENDLKIPAKATPINNKDFLSKMQANTKDDGKNGELILQNAML
ncbi:MAG TPA: GLPGLI family protein [Arachidicoccus sp.]